MVIRTIMIRFLQGNLNMSGPAQNLFIQDMASRGVGLGIVSEPHHVPSDSLRWFSARTALAAIVWASPLNVPCVLLERSHNYVAVKCGNVMVTSCYFSPSMNVAEYQASLDEIHSLVRAHCNMSIIVAGDFNARMKYWGCRDNSPKGELISDAMAVMDLRLINGGNTPTCVRWQRSSVVDLVRVSPDLVERVKEFQVLSDEWESLSDHRNISFTLYPFRLANEKGGTSNKESPRWNIKQFNLDKFRAAMLCVLWNPCLSEDASVENAAKLLIDVATNASDFAVRVLQGLVICIGGIT